MANILKFPTNHHGQNNDGNWLAGYAAGIADARRNGADVETLLKESGLSIKDFIKAGADEYDIEDLKDLFE